jgi:hypothetical protein
MTSILHKTIETASRLMDVFRPAAPACTQPPVSRALLEAGLLLTLETPVDRPPDFLWAHDRTTGAVSVWHPDPATMQRLDTARMTTALQDLLCDTRSHSPASILADADRQARPVKDLEVCWLDDGMEIWWQISICPVPDHAAISATTLGLVRDISPAHDFCTSLAEDEARHSQGLEAGRHLTTALVASLRQNINIVTNISDMLPNETCAAPSGPGSVGKNLALDIRAATDELLMTASLAREYANAHVGSLAINLQTQHFNDV